MTEKTLAGRFLVATPSMKDPFFSKTVILLVGHNAGTGALGLVLNRESSVTMEEACRQLGFGPPGLGRAGCQYPGLYRACAGR